MAAPENPLELLLERAALEPGHRPAFYDALLGAQVFVIGQTEGGLGDGTHVLTQDTRVALEHWQKQDGTPVLPFFTSLAALQRAIGRETRYLALGARDLFEMTRGATLVLNPRSDYGREFLPGEIELLLSGRYPGALGEQVVARDTTVLVGQPETYPEALVRALSTLLPKLPAVRAAYLALMANPSADPKPHLVVGLELERRDRRIFDQLGAATAGTLGPDEVVDFVEVERGEAGLSEYLLRETKPFYVRGWVGTLKSTLLRS